jgi:dTDP-4-dehydrorhamnose 3,5-epimerase
MQTIASQAIPQETPPLPLGCAIGAAVRSTYLEHVAVELTADNHRALYVPQRFAHGYQVLRDGTETSYHVGEFYTPAAESGLRYDDPQLGLVWPLPISEISEKDSGWASLAEIEAELNLKMGLSLTANPS